jgi:hypothetical protein
MNGYIPARLIPIPRPCFQPYLFPILIRKRKEKESF